MVFVNCPLHWSVNLVVMSVFIISELDLNYIHTYIHTYIYIYIHRERERERERELLGGPLQLKILATPL